MSNIPAASSPFAGRIRVLIQIPLNNRGAGGGDTPSCCTPSESTLQQQRSRQNSIRGFLL